MADNTTLNAGAGGDVIATDDIAGVKHQLVKVEFGAADSATMVQASAPLPVQVGDGTDTALVTAGGALLVDASGATVPISNANLTTIAGAVAGTEMQVDVLTMPSVAVTNAGTFATQVNGDALTALQLIDNPVAVLGTATYLEATTSGFIAGAVRRDADTSAVSLDNEIAPLVVDALGRLKVEAFSGETLPVSVSGVATAANQLPDGHNVTVDNAAGASAVNIQDGGNVITVDGTLTTVSTVTNLAQQGGVAISLNTGVRDAGTQRVTIATNDVVPVTDNSGSLTVDAPVGTPVNVQIGNATLSAGVIDETGASAVDALAVGGGTAHDAVDSGNPLKIGGIARQANPTAVAALDRVAATFDDVGRQVCVVGQVRDLMVHQHTQIASSAAETTILTAAASTFHDLTQLVITNETATAVTVTIKDATAGTTRLIVALAASGGAVIPFHRPLTQSAVNGNWTATLSSAAVTVNFLVQAEKNV